MARKSAPTATISAPTPKPVIRVKAVGRTMTRDTFQNFMAGLGVGADNQFSAARYAFNFLTRNRQQLEAGYRGSWIIGAAVDIPADDMTRAGIDIVSTLKSEETDALEAAQRDLMMWQQLGDNIRWGRLFGGSIAVMMIDGQRLDTPLRMNSIGKDQFKGLLVLDRWLLEPSISYNQLVRVPGPDFGLPMYYRVVGDTGPLANMTIHHSRVLRAEGIQLPYYQRQAEQLWSMSVIERMYDRLLAYDSTSQGAAQLVFKAHLRTLKIPKLRELIAAGGPLVQVVMEQIAMIRQLQTNEGLTILDGEDEFETHAYSFTGLDDLLDKFGDQICGAVEIPAARFFGQSPGGLNTDGESHLATYYEGNKRKQEKDLRRPVTILMDVLCRSVLGKPAPPGFTFNFRPLRQMTETDKADVAEKKSGAILAAYDGGLISQKTGMMELRALGQTTGVFSNIPNEDIEAAEEDIPTAEDLAETAMKVKTAAGGLTPGAASEGQTDPKAKASAG